MRSLIKEISYSFGIHANRNDINNFCDLESEIQSKVFGKEIKKVKFQIQFILFNQKLFSWVRGIKRNIIFLWRKIETIIIK